MNTNDGKIHVRATIDALRSAGIPAAVATQIAVLDTAKEALMRSVLLGKDPDSHAATLLGKLAVVFARQAQDVVERLSPHLGPTSALELRKDVEAAFRPQSDGTIVT